MKSQANLDVLKESKEAYSKSIEECELVCESELNWSDAHVLFCVAFIILFHIADNKINESSQNLLNLINRDTKSIQKNLKMKKLP